MVKILSSTDLEYMVCGSKKIDLKLLKRHTEYKKPLKEDSELVRNFWEVVNELSDID